MANMHKGIVIPVTVVEGNITIADTVSVKGDEPKPTLSNPVKQNEAVAIIGDFRVEKSDGSNGPVIGFVHDHPEYDVDPVQNYTKNVADFQSNKAGNRHKMSKKIFIYRFKCGKWHFFYLCKNDNQI